MNERLKDIEDLPQFATVKDVLRVLPLSRTVLYMLVHKKGFPSIRIGRKILIDRDMLIRYLRDNPQTQVG